MTETEKVLFGKLKAYFTVNFMGSVTAGGCDTCGYGGIKGMTLEDIYETIDDFVVEQDTKKK